jgi:hypothetical protein
MPHGEAGAAVVYVLRPQPWHLCAGDWLRTGQLLHEQRRLFHKLGAASRDSTPVSRVDRSTTDTAVRRTNGIIEDLRWV